MLSLRVLRVTYTLIIITTHNSASKTFITCDALNYNLL